jgi:exodeoxyribonuclease V alpha subunit
MDKRLTLLGKRYERHIYKQETTLKDKLHLIMSSYIGVSHVIHHSKTDVKLMLESCQSIITTKMTVGYADFARKHFQLSHDDCEFLNVHKQEETLMSLFYPGLEVCKLRNTNFVRVQAPKCSDIKGCKAIINTIFTNGKKQFFFTNIQNEKVDSNELFIQQGYIERQIPRNNDCFLDYLCNIDDTPDFEVGDVSRHVAFQVKLFANCLNLLIQFHNLTCTLYEDLLKCQETSAVTNAVNFKTLFKIVEHIKCLSLFKEDPMHVLPIMNTASKEVFQTLDKFADCYKVDTAKRIGGALWYILKDTLSCGHTYISYTDIHTSVAKFTTNKDVYSTVNIRKYVKGARCGSEKIALLNIKGKHVIALRSMFKCERNVAKYVKRCIQTKCTLLSKSCVLRSISKYENKHTKVLSEQQKTAVVQIFGGKLLHVVNGGPGRGKSEILKCVRHICNTYKVEYIFLAPTGVASFKIQGSTIHKAYYNFKSEVKRIKSNNMDDFELKYVDLDDVNFWKFELVVVDETSMVDIDLFNKLRSCCRHSCKMVLVGDKDQLPSVGPGEVFLDIIRSGSPSTLLTKNFRNDNDIHNLANHILDCKANTNNFTDLYKDSNNICFVDVEKEQIGEKVLEIYNTFPDDSLVQIVNPFNPEKFIGIDYFNSRIHRMLDVSNTYKAFLEKEKIIGTKNIYDEDDCVMCNGQIGRYVEENDTSVKVDLGDNVCVTVPKDSIKLAHAITVHKAQGSECEIVILVIPSSSDFITRNLLYTGCTRAKSKLFIVGAKEHFFKCCQRERQPRNVLLHYILTDMVKEVS